MLFDTLLEMLAAGSDGPCLLEVARTWRNGREITAHLWSNRRIAVCVEPDRVLVTRPHGGGSRPGINLHQGLPLDRAELER